MSLVLATAVIGGLFAQGVDPGPAHLKHSWTFQDGTPNDLVGGANGTLSGGAWISDGSLCITEQGMYMEMPGADIGLNDYDAITLAAWYMPYQDANAGYTMLAYFGDTVNDAGADGYFITSARGDNKSRAAITCGVYTNPWSGESGADGPEYDDGADHHMASTLTNDTIKLYVDGLLTGATALSAANSISGISANYAYLAKSGYAADPQWIGEIREFDIYNRDLTADEVLFLANRGPVTGVADERAATARPGTAGLSQNYPNPFNPSTSISFELTGTSEVRLAVYDLFGREIERLVDGTLPAGRHTVPFHGGNLGSGMYLCRMEAGGRILTTRMMLLK